MSSARPRGQVVKRGSRWTVILSETDPVSGKRVRRYHSGFMTKTDAERARTRLLGDLDRGEYVAPSKLLVGEYLLEWLEGRRDHLKPTTFDSYRSQIRDHVIPKLGGLWLTGLTPARISDFYRHLRIRGRKDGRGGLSPTSVRYIHRILRRACSDAVRQGLLQVNPMDRVDPPRPADNSAASSLNTWSAEQVSRFLAVVLDDPLYPLWRLALTTGMRRGELLGVQWADVDLAHRRLDIKRTRVSVRYQTAESSPKSMSGYRSVALDQTTVSALKGLRRSSIANALLMGQPFDESDFVFCTADGRPLHPDSVTKSFKRQSKAVGLPEIRFHDCRHTWATLALRAGIHPKVVSERLGHSSVGITLDRYSHAVPAMDAEAAEVVASLIADHK